MRVRAATLVAAAALAAASPAFAQAPSGEAVYKQNCAACHEGNLPRMPARAALREMTPEHVETALSSFSMRRQGASLSSAERRAVAEFVTGRPSGSYRAPTVAGGMLFVNSGYGSIGFMAGNAILAYSVDGK